MLASKVCQENDARNAPITKTNEVSRLSEFNVPKPSIRVVKYVTVTGFRSVSPRTIVYVRKQSPCKDCKLRVSICERVSPRYSNQVPSRISPTALTTRMIEEYGIKMETTKVPARTAIVA